MPLLRSVTRPELDVYTLAAAGGPRHRSCNNVRYSSIMESELPLLPPWGDMLYILSAVVPNQPSLCAVLALFVVLLWWGASKLALLPRWAADPEQFACLTGSTTLLRAVVCWFDCWRSEPRRGEEWMHEGLHLAIRLGHSSLVDHLLVQRGADTLVPHGGTQAQGYLLPDLLARRTLQPSMTVLLSQWDSAVLSLRAAQRLAWAKLISRRFMIGSAASFVSNGLPNDVIEMVGARLPVGVRPNCDPKRFLPWLTTPKCLAPEVRRAAWPMAGLAERKLVHRLLRQQGVSPPGRPERWRSRCRVLRDLEQHYYYPFTRRVVGVLLCFSAYSLHCPAFVWEWQNKSLGGFSAIWFGFWGFPMLLNVVLIPLSRAVQHYVASCRHDHGWAASPMDYREREIKKWLAAQKALLEEEESHYAARVEIVLPRSATYCLDGLYARKKAEAALFGYGTLRVRYY